MRIKVDWELCQGHAVCSEEAPEVFALEEVPGRYPRVRVLQEHPAAEQRARIESAVKHCPTRALSIVEDE